MSIEKKRETLNEFLRLWQKYWELAYPYLTFDAGSPPRLTQNAEEDFMRMKSDALKAFPKVEEICWGPRAFDLSTSFTQSMEASNSLYDLTMNSHNRDSLRKHWGSVHSILNLALGNLEQDEAHARSLGYQSRQFTRFITGPSAAMWLIRLAVLALAAWKLGEFARPLLLPGASHP